MRSLHPWPIFPSNLNPPLARSLSIQFILQGVIESFELLFDLESYTLNQLKGMHIKNEILAVSKQLERFLLFSLENPFAQKPSLLDKLCFYSEILLQASNVSGNEIPYLVEQMKNSILNLKSKTSLWKKIAAVSLSEVLPQYINLYSDLHHKLALFFKALVPYLREARSDESILVYLIENKERLNGFLGTRTVEDLLNSFFPLGLDQLRAVICEGYSRRGFHTFFLKMELLIDALEWEAPCHPVPSH